MATIPLVEVPVDELKKSLYLCYLSYQDHPHFIYGLDRFGIKYSAVKLIQNTNCDSQMYMLLNEGTCYCVFRGSSSVLDYLMDATLHYESFPGDKDVKIHAGFNAQFRSLERDMYDFLQNHNDFSAICFTGHSLGAGIATIATARYFNRMKEERVKKIIKTYTWASPRVGNKAFGEYFAKCLLPEHSWRVYNHRDIVSVLPVRTSMFGEAYSHVSGNTLKLYSTKRGKGKKYRVRPSEESRLNLLLDKIDYHHTETYLQCMQTLFPSPYDLDQNEIVALSAPKTSFLAALCRNGCKKSRPKRSLK